LCAKVHDLASGAAHHRSMAEVVLVDPSIKVP